MGKGNAMEKLTLGDALSVASYADSFTTHWIEDEGQDQADREDAAAACELVERVTAALPAHFVMVETLERAARALVAEFGGNVPDWLDESVGRLENALLPFKDAGAYAALDPARVSLERVAEQCDALGMPKIARNVRKAAALQAKGEIDPTAQPARVLVTMEGGLIQDVTSDLPVDVLVLDFDTDGADEDRIYAIPNPPLLDDAYVSEWQPYEPDGAALIDRIQSAIARQDAERADTLQDEERNAHDK